MEILTSFHDANVMGRYWVSSPVRLTALVGKSDVCKTAPQHFQRETSKAKSYQYQLLRVQKYVQPSSRWISVFYTNFCMFKRRKACLSYFINNFLVLRDLPRCQWPCDCDVFLILLLLFSIKTGYLYSSWSILTYTLALPSIIKFANNIDREDAITHSKISRNNNWFRDKQKSHPSQVNLTDMNSSTKQHYFWL